MQLIGIGLILASCTVAGFVYDDFAAKRVRSLEQLLVGFEILKGEIDYQLTPLEQALDTAAYMTEDGGLFTSFREQLEMRTEVDTKKMWATAINETKEQLFLNDDDIKVLMEFGNAVGYLDKELQKRNIEWTVTRLTGIKDEARIKHEKQSKMYRGLGALIGLSISIVLI
ncbi:MAG: hypothetical protein ATN35_08635 [Epulopiscium sp. Nele67-Bin004]|nr:MAG: hypothetical protein ATN35_08635 [Epulopiscium sp. Nele67-Bin004]